MDSGNNDDGKGTSGKSEGSIGSKASEGASSQRGSGNSGGGKVEDEGSVGDASGIVAKMRGRRGVSEVGITIDCVWSKSRW